MKIDLSQKNKEIYLAAPRGFCAGVDRAIAIVEKALKVYPPPLYINHEIVHNQHVVKSLKEKGVIFVDSLSDVPDYSTVIFSAHGVAPAVFELAKQKKLNVIDATCPLVTKVHIEARRFAGDDYNVILIGHRNHVEAIGTQGEAPDKILIVENIQDVENLSFDTNAKLAYLTQTTLSVLDAREIIERLQEKYPSIEGPKSSDICYATTNRQAAVAEIASKVDLILVIGSLNSSNSNRLRELSEKYGTPSYLIDGADDIESAWISDKIQRIGLTAGASAPEILVREVLARLSVQFGFNNVIELNLNEENVIFQLPKKLRDN